jgi:hypothetical protein
MLGPKIGGIFAISTAAILAAPQHINVLNKGLQPANRSHRMRARQVCQENVRNKIYDRIPVLIESLSG